MIRHHAVQFAKYDAVRYMVECSLSVEATCEHRRSSAVVVLAYVMCDCDGHVRSSMRCKPQTGQDVADGAPNMFLACTFLVFS